MIQQSFSEYNTACKIKKIIHSSRDRDGSVDGTLHHGLISAADAVDNVSMIFKPELGFFQEHSTRYLSSNLVGDISVEIVFAPTSILCFKEATIAINANFSDGAARAAALNPTYTVKICSPSLTQSTLGSSMMRC